MVPAGLMNRVQALLGPRGYLHRPEDLKLYEYDGGVDKHAPDLVAFPRTTEEVAALVKLAREFNVPFVGRGAGTGLSGGAIPREGGLMVAFARMNRILELDYENERAWSNPASSTWTLPSRSMAAAISTRPIPPASAPAPSAATSPKTPAGRTLWRTASLRIMCSD